jgi:biotin carboxylase
MGDKTEARRRMEAAGVPIVPGAFPGRVRERHLRLGLRQAQEALGERWPA